MILSQDRKLCAHPFLEIYSNDVIHFMAPLARQGDFYVPEARLAERRLSEQEELDSDSEISGIFNCTLIVFLHCILYMCTYIILSSVTPD